MVSTGGGGSHSPHTWEGKRLDLAVGDGVSGSRKPPEQARSLCIAVVPP